MLGSWQPDAVSVCAVCILLGFLASASLLARHWEAIENWSAEEPAQAWADLEEPLHSQVRTTLDRAAEGLLAVSPRFLLLTCHYLGSSGLLRLPNFIMLGLHQGA